MKLKLEADFHYWSSWNFSVLVIFISLTIAYYQLLNDKSSYSITIGLLAIFFMLVYIITHIMYGVTYYKLRKLLKDNKKEKEKMSNLITRFLKVIFHRQHFMNYTYSYFGGIFAAITIAFILGQNPFGYHWYTILIFALISFVAGLFCCTVILYSFIRKIK